MRFYSSINNVDVDLYEERLNYSNEIYMDMTEVGVYFQQQLIKACTLQRLCLRYMNLHSSTGYSSLNSDSILHYLQSVERVPRELFKKKGVARESLDKIKVLIPLRERNYAVDFLNLYIEYQESNNRSNNMMALFNRNSNNEKVNGWNEKLTVVPFSANKNVNLRFNYSKENIVGFPKAMEDVIKVPKEYILVWGDFAQSDARIAYNTLLKDGENIKYIDEFPDDIYAGFANWTYAYQRTEIEKQIKNAEDFRQGVYEDTGVIPSDSSVSSLKERLRRWKPFKGFKNKEERDLYKIYCLETIYGTRRHQVPAANNFISAFGRVLDDCPKYQKYWADIEKRTTFGVPLRVHCYMGHIEHIAAFDGKRKKETLYKCLNYPVQGGTSEIIIMTVNNLLDSFYNLGYTEDDIRVYYVRHDEPIFIMKKTVMKDSWIFKDFETIQIDDWIPLKLEFSIGRTYGKADEDLMCEYELSVKINSTKINICNRSHEEPGYYPLDPILEIAFYIEPLEDSKKLIVIYRESDNSFDYEIIRILLKDITDADILVEYINKFLKKIYSLGYRQVVIYNKSFREDFVNSTVNVICLYRPSSNIAIYRAQVINMAIKSKIENNPNQIVNKNKEFLASVNRMKLFKDDNNENTKTNF